MTLHIHSWEAVITFMSQFKGICISPFLNWFCIIHVLIHNVSKFAQYSSVMRQRTQTWTKNCTRPCRSFCPSFFFGHCEKKNMNQNQLGEKMSTSSYTSIPPSFTQESQCMDSGQEPGVRIWSRGTGAMLPTGWLLIGCSTCLLGAQRTKDASRDGTHHGLGPSTSIFNLENAPEILLTGRSEDPVSDVTLVFVSWQKTNQATCINFQVVGFVPQERERFLKTKKMKQTNNKQ